MQEKLRHTLRKAFFEAAFVVFGVVLALAANEWRQNVKAAELAADAQSIVVGELQANLDLVTESLTYHENRVEMLRKKLGAGEAPTMQDFPRGFIHPAFVTDAAWDVAKATGVVADMDYETVLKLSEAYKRMERYTKQSDIAGEHIYRTMFMEGSQAIVNKPGNLMNILYTFVYREMQLQENLAATLEALKE